MEFRLARLLVAGATVLAGCSPKNGPGCVSSAEATRHVGDRVAILTQVVESGGTPLNNSNSPTPEQICNVLDRAQTQASGLIYDGTPNLATLQAQNATMASIGTEVAGTMTASPPVGTRSVPQP